MDVIIGRMNHGKYYCLGDYSGEPFWVINLPSSNILETVLVNLIAIIWSYYVHSLVHLFKWRSGQLDHHHFDLIYGILLVILWMRALNSIFIHSSSRSIRNVFLTRRRLTTIQSHLFWSIIIIITPETFQ